jgi:hypothetical protein
MILIRGGWITPYVKSNYQIQCVWIFDWLFIFSKLERIRKEEVVTYFNVLGRNSTGRTEDILVKPLKHCGICIHTICFDIKEPCILPTQLTCTFRMNITKTSDYFCNKLTRFTFEMEADWVPCKVQTGRVSVRMLWAAAGLLYIDFYFKILPLLFFSFLLRQKTVR